MCILTLYKLLHKFVNLKPGNIGHDDDVGNILFAGQLPTFNEFVVHGAFEDYGAREVI
jgi:hypothetical protein